MNPPNEPNPPVPPNPSEAQVPPLPPPIDLEGGPGSIIEALLKRPAELAGALQRATHHRASVWLAGFAILALAAYGLIVGSYSGGQQMLIAPLKISLGALASMLICLPSLFIFASLTGANVSLRAVLGIASAVLALTALLLIGFAPVAWVFSQASESVSFIGGLHLLFWLIGLGFGLRLLRMLLNSVGIQHGFHLRIWAAIFVLVSLQMTTALRPIVGTSDHWLPKEKRFFIAHWFATLDEDSKPKPAAQ